MSQNKTLCFLLFGKIKFDEDSVGNYPIPGMEFFDSDVTFDAVTSTCTLWRGTRRGTIIEVVDCLDLFGAERTEGEVTTGVVQAFAFMHPGPLAFVYVIMVSDLYTGEESRVYERLKVLLGPDVTEYTIIVLLTRGDGRDRKRSSLQDVLSTAPDHVHKVLEECGHRYVVFGNAADDRQSQVEDLIEAVHKLSEKHGGKAFSCPKNSEIGERIESQVERRKQEELEEKSKKVQKELAEGERREKEKMEKERDEQTRKDKDRIVQLEAMVETLKQQQLDAERMHEKDMERKTEEETLALEKQRDLEQQRKEETAALEQKNQELQQMHEKCLQIEKEKLQEAERHRGEMEKAARRLREADEEEVKRKQHVKEMEENMKRKKEEMEKQKSEFERKEKERDDTMKIKAIDMSKRIEMETLKLEWLADQRIHQAEMDFRRKMEEERRKEAERLKEIVTPDEIRFVLLGKTGVGKSSTANTILGSEMFATSHGFYSETSACEVHRRFTFGVNIEITKTPCLFDGFFGETEMAHFTEQALAYMHPGPHVFLFLVKIGRFTQEEADIYKRLVATFDQLVNKHMVIVFTGGDFLRPGQTIDGILVNAPASLKDILAACENRYVVFDNYAADKKPQVERLLQAAQELIKKNGNAYYSCAKYLFAEKKRGKEIRKRRRMALMNQTESRLKEYIEELEEKNKELKET